MPPPAGASTTTVGGKPRTVFPRQEATTNDTAKGPPVPAAAAVPPPTSSSSAALAGIANAAAVLESSSVVQSSVVVGPSTSAIPPSTPTSSSKFQSAISSASPAATSIIASSIETTTSSVLQDSLTSSTKQLPTTASPSTPDSGVTPSSSSQSFLASSSGPLGQPVSISSRTPSAIALAAIGPSSSFETLPSLSSTSDTATQTVSSTSLIPVVTTIPSAITPTKAAGESTATPSAAASANLSAPPKSIVGVVMGGVVGGLALVGILLFFWWRYHRKRGSRHSLLTPLNTHFNDTYQSEKYEIDGISLGPTPRGTRWRAQAEMMCSRAHMSMGNFGSSVKAKLGGRDNTPTINMDRGNSQFLESSPQHSRSGSATSVGAVDALVNGECFRDRWNRFTQKVLFNWRLHTGAVKLTGRSVTKGNRTKKEPRRDRTSPEFPGLLATSDRGLRLGSSGHRRSLSTAGLYSSTVSNPFADPYPSAQPTIPDLTKPPAALTSNPFQSALDPFSSPKSNSSNYLANVQRSRGLSQPTATSSAFGARPLGGNAAMVKLPPRYTSTTTAAQPGSRYPSLIRNSMDSNRDTVLSAYSTSGRKAKCRSDPFDLERPEILRPAMPVAPENQPNNMGISASPRISTGATTQVRVQPRAESILTGRIRIVSEADSYASSKYSSGASAVLHEWGDSGPDLGSFASETGPPIPPRERDRRRTSNLAQEAGAGSESTEGVVGRAL